MNSQFLTVKKQTLQALSIIGLLFFSLQISAQTCSNINGDIENEGTTTSFETKIEGTPASFIQGKEVPLGWEEGYGPNVNVGNLLGGFYLRKDAAGAGNPRSGSHYIFLRGKDNCLASVKVNSEIACGATFTFSGYVAAYTLSGNQSAAPFKMEVVFEDTNAVLPTKVAEISASSPASSGWNNLNWQKVTMTAVVPMGLNNVPNGYNKIKFYFTSDDNTTGILIDDVCVSSNFNTFQPNPGFDQIQCSSSVFNIIATTPSVGTGVWSVQSGTANITNPNNASTKVTGVLPNQTAVLKWSVNIKNCPSISKNIQLKYVNGVEICDNNIDDDCDGFIDAADPDCGNTANAFPCNDDMYMLRANPANNAQTLIERLSIKNNVPTNTLLFTANNALNALAYFNGYLYAMDNNGRNLYRLDAQGNVVNLGAVNNLPNPNTQWSGATVDRNGNYYVIEGTVAPNYRMFRIPLLPGGNYTATQVVGPGANGSITIPGNPSDIAIDETGTMFAFIATVASSFNSGLYTINLTTGEGTKVGSQTFSGQSMGSLFAAADGNLYSYGTVNDANLQQNKFYQVNKTTGEVTQIGTTGTAVGRSDGCSCPWRITVKRTTTTSCLTPDGSFCWDFKLNNQYGSFIGGVILSDTLDARFSYTFDIPSVETTLRAIYGNAMSVSISSFGSGTNNVVTIFNMAIPNNESNISLCGKVLSNAIFAVNEIVYEQAFLKNLPAFLGSIEPSDYPATLGPVKDPSPITIAPAAQAKATFAGVYCENDVIELKATGGTTYSWSGPNGFSSNDFAKNLTAATPSMSGIYSVTVTNASGCPATAKVKVVVATTPSATAGDDQSQCNNVFTMAANTPSVGTGIWTIINGNATILDKNKGNTSITVTSATAVLRWTININSSCNAFDDVLLNVAQPLSITSQPTAFSECVGGNLSLNVTFEGGAGTDTYQWQSSSDNAVWNDISGATNTTFQPSSAVAGTTYFRVIIRPNAPGCTEIFSNSTPVTIIAKPKVAVTVTTQSVCVGGEVTLKANIIGGLGCTPQWQNSVNGGLNWNDISGETNATFTVKNMSKTTKYRVNVNCNGNGCCN